MRAITTARITNNIFQKANAYRFCVHFAPLDPRKHTTMIHNTGNMYMDLWEYGKYPEWVHIGSTAPRTYEAQVLNVVAATLSEKLVQLTTLREPPSPPDSSSPNAIDHGPSSFPKTSNPTNNSMNSTPPF